MQSAASTLGLELWVHSDSVFFIKRLGIKQKQITGFVWVISLIVLGSTLISTIVFTEV